MATLTASSSPICLANCDPSVECVVMNPATCFIPITGNAASRLARATPLPCELIRRKMNEIIRAVLISSVSNPSPFRLMSSPNHCACSAASAWQ